MKKLMMFLFLFVSLVWGAVGFAQDTWYLVCDAYAPEYGVTHFLLAFDEQPAVQTPAPLHYDLSGLPNGSHIVTAIAVNDVGESESSDPFLFKLGLPKKPSGVGLSNQ